MSTQVVDVNTLLTPNQVAAYLQVHPYTVRKWLREGRLKGISMGGKTRWRIPLQEVDRYLKNELQAIASAQIEVRGEEAMQEKIATLQRLVEMQGQRLDSIERTVKHTRRIERPAITDRQWLRTLEIALTAAALTVDFDQRTVHIQHALRLVRDYQAQLGDEHGSD